MVEERELVDETEVVDEIELVDAVGAEPDAETLRELTDQYAFAKAEGLF